MVRNLWRWLISAGLWSTFLGALVMLPGCCLATWRLPPGTPRDTAVIAGLYYALKFIGSGGALWLLRYKRRPGLRQQLTALDEQGARTPRPDPSPPPSPYAGWQTISRAELNQVTEEKEGTFLTVVEPSVFLCKSSLFYCQKEVAIPPTGTWRLRWLYRVEDGHWVLKNSFKPERAHNPLR